MKFLAALQQSNADPSTAIKRAGWGPGRYVRIDREPPATYIPSPIIPFALTFHGANTRITQENFDADDWSVITPA